MANRDITLRTIRDARTADAIEVNRDAITLVGLTFFVGFNTSTGAVASVLDAGSTKYLLTDIPAPNPDVEVVSTFPDYPDRAFPGGERVKVLLGVRNAGNDDVNVTYIAGSLNVPNNFAFYVTNFTANAYGDAIVKPRQEATFTYEFVVDPQFAGHSLQLALTTFYDEAGASYATTFFNATVPVLDPKVVFDRELVMIYLTLAGVAVLALAGVLKAVGLGHLLPYAESSKDTKKKSAVTVKKVVERQPSAVERNPSEWLEGSAFAKSASQRDAKRTSKKKA